MKTHIQLKNSIRTQLPSNFRHNDIRYSESLVEYFLREFTAENDVVFDRFAGFGTTLLVAQAMHRIPYGIEFEPDRGQYIQSKLDVGMNTAMVMTIVIA